MPAPRCGGSPARPPTSMRPSTPSRRLSARRSARAACQRIRALFRKSEPEMSRLDINSLIDEVVTLVRNEALNRRVTLRLECASGLPAVYGDRIQLQQVIINHRRVADT